MKKKFEVNKDSVYTEVARSTSYTGAKMTDDASAYERIFATEHDLELIERFWSECRDSLVNALKKQIDGEHEIGSVYTITLELSSSFDDALSQSMQRSIFSYFVSGISAKWYMYTNKAEAAAYAAESAGFLDDITKKAYYKRRPTRPTYY